MTQSLDARLRTGYRMILESIEAMYAAKDGLLVAVTEAQDRGYTLGEIAEAMGATKRVAQKYAEQARERVA